MNFGEGKESIFINTGKRQADQCSWMTPIIGDPQRPVYHFLPPRFWMNDPNGLIQFKGEYHLFFQFNPRGNKLRNICWGHARSRDLINWQLLPLALRPDKPYDGLGAWSGCVVDNNGMATAIYTGVASKFPYAQTQCVATSSDMAAWEKYDGNPVISKPPLGVTPWCFRDPYVIRHLGSWLMVVGASLFGAGAALLFGSDDLRKWEYLHPLYSGNPWRNGWMWECPSFFALGPKWALMVSRMGGKTGCFIGDFENLKFRPESFQDLDLGGSLYAPQVFGDDSGRMIMFGWLRENRLNGAKAGWQGVQSLPRVLGLDEQGRLLFSPAREVEALRRECEQIRDTAVSPGGDIFVETRGDSLEIILQAEPGGSNRVGLGVRRSPDGSEQTLIYYDARTSEVVVDRTSSSLDNLTDKSRRSAPLALSPGEPLQLRVFIDKSVIEVFANGRVCLTCRVYPRLRDSLGVRVFAQGGEAAARNLEVWKMKPAEIQLSS